MSDIWEYKVTIEAQGGDVGKYLASPFPKVTG
jgi:hypothetical protein